MSSVGKTSLLRKYVQDRFVPSYKPTIGSDFFTKEAVVNGESVSLQCWDTAGQEKYHSISTSFYKGANCCILVYDVTNMQSFGSLAAWRERFINNASSANPSAAQFIVLANKVDLTDARKVRRPCKGVGPERERARLVQSQQRSTILRGFRHERRFVRSIRQSR
jgi:Ras-related protein Rab-7A